MLLSQQEEGEDLLKKKQLKDLALLNGTLRETGAGASVKEFYPGKYFGDSADRLLAETEKFKMLDRNRVSGISLKDNGEPFASNLVLAINSSPHNINII